MALPLLWLGVAAVSALAVKGLNDDRKTIQRNRLQSYKPQTLAHLDSHESPVAIYPSDFLVNQQTVKPEVGAIVCCGIGGVLDHSGIWLGDDMIVELSGSGLVKAVSSQRFLKERSGKQIFIACDSIGKPLANISAAKIASGQIFQFHDYHMFDNNCHQFIWQCFKADDEVLSTFKTLSYKLAHFYDRIVYWDVCDC